MSKQSEYWGKILNSGSKEEIIELLNKVGLDKDSIEVFLNKFDEIDKQVEEEQKYKLIINVELKKVD